MKILFRFLISVLLMLTVGTAQGQITCPENIDFEQGNTSIWEFFIGTCCPSGAISATTATAAIVNRHTLTSGGGTDAYGGFPIVAPGGGSYSLRLGNSNTGSEAEKARYFVHVPAGAAEYALIYRFAVVLEDPRRHTLAQKPRFEVTAVDSATGVDIPCAQYTYISTGSMPGFETSRRDTEVHYKAWSTAAINLSGRGGSTVELDFATGDCDLGGHFGYAYIDMSCGLFAIVNYSCDTNDTRLGAPDGFMTYEWYDSTDMTTLLDTGQYVTITTGRGRTFAVVITPFTGYGCPDTLYTKVLPPQLAVRPLRDTTLCFASGLTLTADATDFYFPLTYAWSSSAPLSCATCETTDVNPTSPTTVYLQVTNPVGCSVYDTMVIDGKFLTVELTTTDATCAAYANGSSTARLTSGSAVLTYLWATSPAQTTATASGLAPGIYAVRITDTDGCSGIFYDTIGSPPPLIVRYTDSTDPTTCGGSDGRISIAGFTPLSTDTIRYRKDGVPTVVVLVADGGGAITISGLSRGVYDSFRVITSGCPYNALRDITLTDPPLPPLPYASSDAPICEGDTVRFSNMSGGAGITYLWTGPGGFSSTLRNPMRTGITMADSGLYRLTVVRANCFVYDSTLVIVKPKPEPVASGTMSLCAGDTIKLLGYSRNGGESLRWSGPNFFSSISSAPTIPNVDTVASGIYTLTYVRSGCVATASVAVVVHGIPSPPVVSDTAYCQFATPVPLSAVGINLTWYPGGDTTLGTAATPTPSTIAPGTFTWRVRQTSPFGCAGPSSLVSVTVVPFPTLDIAFSDSVACVGAPIVFSYITGGERASKVYWIFGDGDTSMNASPTIHSYLHPGTYIVQSYGTYHVCPRVAIGGSVKIFDNPHVFLGQDTSICLGGGEFQLAELNNKDASASWRWGNGETSNAITVSTPGSYYVTVNVNGCEASDTIVIEDGCYLHIPNAFTPNADGVNDTYLPRPLMAKGLTKFEMQVFNRWGQVVFTSSKVEGAGWDGTLNDVPQPTGVYIYKVKAEFVDGQRIERTGNFTLLR